MCVRRSPKNNNLENKATLDEEEPAYQTDYGFRKQDSSPFPSSSRSMSPLSQNEHSVDEKQEDSRDVAICRQQELAPILDFVPPVHQLYEQELFPELEFSRRCSESIEDSSESMSAQEDSINILE